MKQLRTATLTALALCALGAGAVRAAGTASYSNLQTSITGNGVDIGTLYNGTTLTATSVTFGSLILTPPAQSTSLLAVLGYGQNGQGNQDQGNSIHRVSYGDFDGGRGHIFPFPTTTPIPEARTALLYALGLSGVSWALLRLRRRQRAR